MFTKALFPVDLEDIVTAEHALKYLNGMLSQGQEIHLLGVLPGFNMPLVASYFPEGAMETAIAAMEHQLTELAELNLGDSVQWQVHVAEGKTYSTILDHAEKLGADLIVMPSHKRSKIDKVVLGSVASKVVQNSPINVLVVKPQG